MNYTNENGRLVIFLSGRVDSSNADTVESELTGIRKAEAHTELALDADTLQYISSAGLRVVLRARKEEPTLEIINASSEVYDILDMTGFTEMIPVHKAFRKVSVEGCEVIGRGANGEVYRLDPDTIIKVYLNPDSLPDIKRERELARKAFVLGIPTAIPYDVVRVGSGYGSVFELLNAKSFAKLLKANPEKLDEYVALYVDLLKKIHSTEVDPADMPDMKAVALDWAHFLKDHLPAQSAEKLISMIGAVPDSNKMMHGDYHVKNVMLQNGETLLIDMDTLCHGHPVFELASMFNAYCGFAVADHSVTEDFLGIPYDTAVAVWKKSLALYLGTEDETRLSEIEKKAQLVGYTRLLRRAIRRGTPENSEEMKAFRSNLISLIDSVDSLSF